MGTKLPRKLEQKMQVVGDQAGQIAQKSQYRSDCRTCHLFTPHGFAHRERSADSGYMYLSQSALCASIR